jgi:hypothetical protein
MISPEARVLYAVLLFQLLLPAETQLPRPPEIPFIYDYFLPPGPARPIDEFILRKESVSRHKATEAATVSQPAASAVVPAPEVLSEPVRPDSSRPVRMEERASSGVKEPVRLADLEPDIYARLDDSFSLYFSGDSWLFTESYPDEKGVEYRGRSREAGGMRFSFRARNLGRYLLTFVPGGSEGGVGEGKRMLVEILPEAEFLSRIGVAVSGGEKASAAGEEKSQDGEVPPQELYSKVWELLLGGNYPEGFALLERPELQGRIERPELAAALFIAGTLADTGDDTGRLMIRDSGFSAAERGEFIRRILGMSRRFTDTVRLRLLHSAVDEFQDLQGADALLFELAELYQQAGEYRDFEAAMRYYGRVVDEYPLSPLWDESRSRRIYLERHFLLVR